MKKNLFISSLVALLSISTVVGCDNTSSSSSNQITSSPVENILSEEAKLDLMLTNLRKGVQLKGVLDQKVVYLDNYQGNPTGKTAMNTFDVELNYSAKDVNSYAAYVSYVDEAEGTEIDVINTSCFEGEDGYAYYYGLNYDNTIVSYPVLDKTGSEHMNFAYYYLNPFNYIMGKDLIKVEEKENTYTLNKGKAAFFASNVLGDVDPAFFGVINEIEFTIENYELKAIKVIPDIAYDSQTDYETWENIFYYLDQTVILEVKNAGTHEIEKPEVRKTKDEHAALQAALDQFSSNNFTINLQIEKTRDGEANGKENATYYYDGSNLHYVREVITDEASAEVEILFYQYEGDEFLTILAYDADADEFTQEASGSLSSMNNIFKYNDVTPRMSEVKAEIFDYDKNRKNYRVCDELVSTIGAFALVPPINPCAQELNGLCSSFVVKLTADGAIDYVTFTTQSNSFYNDVTKGKITFENIGTTTLPEHVYVEEK